LLRKRFSDIGLRKGSELFPKERETKLLTPLRYSIGNVGPKVTSSAGPVSGESVEEDDVQVVLSKSTSVPIINPSTRLLSLPAIPEVRNKPIFSAKH